MEKYLYGKSWAKENSKISFLAKKEKYIMKKVLIDFIDHLILRTSFNKLKPGTDKVHVQRKKWLKKIPEKRLVSIESVVTVDLQFFGGTLLSVCTF